MSRGTDVAKYDEQAAVWAIGQAINYAALDYAKGTGCSYESARNAVAEDMSWALTKLLKAYYKNEII